MFQVPDIHTNAGSVILAKVPDLGTHEYVVDSLVKAGVQAEEARKRAQLIVEETIHSLFGGIVLAVEKAVSFKNVEVTINDEFSVRHDRLPGANTFLVMVLLPVHGSIASEQTAVESAIRRAIERFIEHDLRGAIEDEIERCPGA